MTTTLEIPDALFSRIIKHAVPFVDKTPISVIEKWADHYEKTHAPGNVPPPASISVPRTFEGTGKKFSATQPPDLFHTRCKGTFDSVAFSNWNDLLRIAHIKAYAKAKSFEALKAVTNAQIRKGAHSDSGYHFVRDINISIQGVDANHAWVYSLRLAQYLNTSVKVSIEWRHNDKAAFPGQSGVLEWNA